MKKAIYFDILNYTGENLSLLQDSFDLIRLEDPSQLRPGHLAEASLLFAPLGYFFGREFFEKAPCLRVIASNTTGVPHIDEQAAAERGIRVFSLKGETGFLERITPTAELTLGLILCLTRNMIPARESVLDGRWNRWDFGGQAMLSRMSLGIVGLGRLGRIVAGYGAALGMEVRFYDPCPPGDRSLTCTRMTSLQDLLCCSDIVSVHADLHEHNIHLFDREAFSAFKPGAYFINTARGELVDSLALIRALEEGILKGAALDVLDHEFEPGFAARAGTHPLVEYARKNNNLIITPHIAGSTRDAWHLTQRFVIDKTLDFLGLEGEVLDKQPPRRARPDQEIR
ncbi:MAG: hydroxyacid dehydrogenase [Desulfohalobiaceae bacterium]|nr:hydroxyacid dehydrogenase [Desulfohalobiaceae bacterium]